jgi:hypothetical protein
MNTNETGSILYFVMIREYSWQTIITVPAKQRFKLVFGRIEVLQ